MDIQIKKYDEVYNTVICPADIKEEMTEHFTFEVPGAKWSPRVRNGVWDGKIRLLNKMSGRIYTGLTDRIKEFAQSNNYEIDIDPLLKDDEFTIEQAKEFIETINLPLQVRDYQLEGFVHAVKRRRAMMVCPTGSGKSLMIYLLARWFGGKALIIVPSVSLVHQFLAEIKGYGYEDALHGTSVNDRMNAESDIVVTTWQSIESRKPPQKWFDQFIMMIGDEGHTFKAKSLVSIMQSFKKTQYKFGFTGSMDGYQTNEMVLIGLFGPVEVVAKTVDLIDMNFLSKLKISGIRLKYPEEVRKAFHKRKPKPTYQEEISFVIAHEERNKFIKKLALGLEGNTLLLFGFVEKHGDVLYEMIKDCGVPVYYVHGGIKAEIRESIRNEVETLSKSIIIASYGTFSTGINIKNLHNIIFGSPSKSKTRVLQSIGRVLRISQNKDGAVLYDLADDLSWKSKENYALLHFLERCKFYDEQRFDYKNYSVEFKT